MKKGVSRQKLACAVFDRFKLESRSFSVSGRALIAFAAYILCRRLPEDVFIELGETGQEIA